MENSNLLLVILFSLIGGLLSLSGGILLLRTKKGLDKFTRLSIPYAAGALLGAVFFDLLPDGLEESSQTTVLTAVLIGIVVFFVMERLTHWFHHHHDEDAGTDKKSTFLIIFGDTVHNALDGIVIASAFLINVPTGIITTIAVAVHELPQEIGDFGVLLERGMSRARVLLVNIWSALATTVLAIVTYLLGSSDRLPVGAMLGLSAGFLLYIALSDLIPSIHDKKSQKGKVDPYIVLLLLGLLTVFLAVELSHRYIHESHEGVALEQAISA